MRPSIPVAVSLCLLAACQSQPSRPPPSMSIEEAKSITADFPSSGFVPPPRTIEDVTAILDQQTPDESYKARLLDSLNHTPTHGASAAALAAYFGARAQTLLALGRVDEAEAAASDGVRYATQAGEGVSVAFSVLASVHFWGYGSGVEQEWFESLKAARAQRPTNTVMVIIGLRQMAQLAAERGDLATASQMAAESDRTLPPSRGSTEEWLFARSVADNAEAHYHVEIASGRYRDAEVWIRKAVANWRAYLAHFTSPSVPDENSALPRRRLITLQTYLTLTLMAQGRTVEAEAVARDALLYALTYGGRDSPGGWIAMENLAQVLFAQGRAADAERLFAVGVGVREKIGTPSSNARNWTADAIAMQSRWADALALYNDDREPRIVGEPYAIYPRIMALYSVGRVEEGLSLARPASKRSIEAFGDNSPDAALAQGFVAAGLAQLGNRSTAAAVFRTTLPSLLRSGAAGDSLDGASAPTLKYRRFVLESYMTFQVGTRADPVTIAETFTVADALRVAVTDHAVAASVARSRLPSAELADLARREQDAQQQIGALQATLANSLSLPVEQQNAAALSTLRGEIERLKQARTVLSHEVEKRFPDYVNLVNPPPATIEQARAVLTNDEALVALYSAENESYVWALRKSGDVAFAVIPLRREQLAEMVGRLRRSLDPNASTLGEIPPFDVALAYELYAAILQPVEAGWKGAKTLIVAPHGPMGQIPFSLLVTRAVSQPKDGTGALFSGYKEVPFLLREMAISQVPSVASLAILRGMPPANPARHAFVGFGDPWFSAAQAAQARAEQTPDTIVDLRGFHLRAAPATESLSSATLAMLPRLPDTAEEVREVAKTLKANAATDVYLGAGANERQVRTMTLDDRRVVMFATHGLVPGDLDGLTQPALALSAPGVAGIDGDGLLTMEKVLGLKLDADWVVLSACNTAAGNGAGAEAVSGLGRAFFYAGARALLVTNWPVETTSARALTTQIFKRQAAEPHLTRADALRQSMLSMLDGPGYTDASGRIVYAYAHPIFWAPFTLVGDGR